MPIKPTEEQKWIVESDSQRILVEANAGAAKTTTAAMKIWKLANRGVDPSRICALAFSAPGVKAYKQAFQRIGMPGFITSKVRVSTVDEFCAEHLKKFDSTGTVSYRYAREVKPFVLEAIRTARDISNERFPGEFSIQGTGVMSVEFLLEEFSYLKGTLRIQRYGDYFRYDPITADDLGCDYTSLVVFRQYESARSGFMLKEGWGTKFRYVGDATYDMARHLESDDQPWGWEEHPFHLGLEGIVLDEMHDCGWSIFTVIRHLMNLNPQASFMGIGDRDQVIHGKYGADSYFMGPDLDRELGEISRFPLTLTHRFGKDVSRPLALFCRKEYQSSTSAETQVSLHIAAEAKDNVNLIFELVDRYNNVGSTEEDFAVLLRHPGSSVELEHSLTLRGMNYKTVGFKTFLQRPEIAFARMLLSIAIDHQTHFTSESLLEAKRAVWEFFGANLPAPNTAEETERVMGSASESNFKSFVFTALLSEADKQVITSVHAALDIAESNDPQKVTQFVKALNFSAMAQKVLVSKRDIEEATFSIESFGEVAKHYETIDGMLSAMNSMDFQQRKSSTTRHQLRLSTIEEAKGLEFRCVFIPECNAMTFDGPNQDERNLFYVAASRARENLMVSYKKGAESTYLKHFM